MARNFKINPCLNKHVSWMKPGWLELALSTLKVLLFFIQEATVLMKLHDPSWHSLNIGFFRKMFAWHRVIRGNWIPSSISCLKLMSVDKGWLQYFTTALLPHQRNNEIKQNSIKFLPRHVFFNFSLILAGIAGLAGLARPGLEVSELEWPELEGLIFFILRCLHQGEIKQRSLTWYKARFLCPPFAKVGPSLLKNSHL